MRRPSDVRRAPSCPAVVLPSSWLSWPSFYSILFYSILICYILLYSDYIILLFCLSVYLSICLSVYLSVCLSIYLSPWRGLQLNPRLPGARRALRA